MVKTRFYAIRHGQTAWNAEGRFQGLTDVPLSPEGYRQVSLCGARLAGLFQAPGGLAAPVRIITSPLARARATAEILREAIGLPPTSLSGDPRLREAGFGRWEGLTTLEVKRTFPEERRRRRADRWTFAPPGGQSYEDLARAMESLLAGLDGEEPTLLVTHSGNLRALMTLAGGMTREGAMHAPTLHDALYVFAGGMMEVC